MEHFFILGYETLYEGTEREHICEHLVPGHMYRVRVACCSSGGRSDVSTAVPPVIDSGLLQSSKAIPVLIGPSHLMPYNIFSVINFILRKLITCIFFKQCIM